MDAMNITTTDQVYENYLMLLQDKQMEICISTPQGQVVRALTDSEQLACALEAMGA